MPTTWSLEDTQRSSRVSGLSRHRVTFKEKKNVEMKKHAVTALTLALDSLLATALTTASLYLEVKHG
ncbi:hypothetical protein P9A06_03025 [Serratia marcescens]|jgi:hypothetical protein|uniref:hypothetical protein n=1 Tax=Serratia TaxID=613 RepID=UPI001BD09D7F|nr:hypothetical protein [Serratia ureilytica]MBS7521528.1 hypothetical protein [Serratia ureilytica]